MKKLVMLIGFISILRVLSFGFVSAQVSVGVQQGDWIEYSVIYTGSPPSHYPKWIRIEVTDIQETIIFTDLTVERLDGTSETNSGTYDLEIGVFNLLLIPAGLEVGDEFYHEDFGEIAINGTEEYTYTDAKRTVVYATVEQASIHWDKATGILLQGNQSTDDFTQKLLVDKTNMWQLQSFGLDSALLYILIVAILVLIAVVAVLLFRRR